ncbi:MAG TPA: hypothetical protein VGL93_21960 [Streptosporangiaceae bacterium]
MRYRVTFAAGLAVGYVLGARAGRERYEQIKRAARRAADSPAVQAAAGVVQQQAAGLAGAARDKAAEKLRLPRRDAEQTVAYDHLNGSAPR